MSSAQGFPDWQRITQWLGPPIVQQTGYVIGAGAHADGPFQVSNFASVMVALKATGGPVTVTIKQTVPAGPAALILTESVVVAAGATLFEAFVLFGGAVELDLQGAIAGTSVDYALYGSNTTTNAQVITSATINVQHNEVLVAAEATLDFVDGAGGVWTITDDAPNTRVKVFVPTLAQLVSHTEITSPINIAAGSTSAAPTTLITAPAFTFDGVTKYDFIVYADYLSTSAAGVECDVGLYEDGVFKCMIGFATATAAARQYVPFGQTCRSFVPTAGAHTYSVRGFNGTGQFGAGSGTGGTDAPAFLRIVKAPV